MQPKSEATIIFTQPWLPVLRGGKRVSRSCVYAYSGELTIARDISALIPDRRNSVCVALTAGNTKEYKQELPGFLAKRGGSRDKREYKCKHEARNIMRRCV